MSFTCFSGKIGRQKLVVEINFNCRKIDSDGVNFENGKI